MKKQTFKFIDLFAGVGGVRIPFEELGGECVFTSEWDKFAKQTYQENHEGAVHGDITQINEKDIPEHNLILAGFPCQAFSNAGKRGGFEDTRGTLFFDVLRIAREHKPKALLLENVRGLLSHDEGNTFKVIVSSLEEIGYKVFHKVLYARDYGVPQNRPRIYLACFRKDIIGDREFIFPDKSGIKTKLGDILEKNVPEKYTISDKLWAYLQNRKQEQKEKGNGFGFTLFNKNSVYVNTMSARYYKDGSEILIEQKGKNPRRLTPREAARLQGFPDSFKIPVSDTQFYKQMGNSVSVPVIRAVAKEIVKYIK